MQWMAFGVSGENGHLVRSHVTEVEVTSLNVTGHVTALHQRMAEVLVMDQPMKHKPVELRLVPVSVKLK